MKEKLGLQFELWIDDEGIGHATWREYERREPGKIVSKGYVLKGDVPRLVEAIKTGDLKKVLEIYIKILEE